MIDLRNNWLGVLDRYCLDPERPDSDRYWSTKLDTASVDQLHAIQNEKLRAAAHYCYWHIPFYRRKFDRIGIHPDDVKSIDDLAAIPITTKQEMVEDLANNSPWGEYTAVDDHTWRQRGWQIFTTSGTTAQPRIFRYTQFDRKMWAWTNARAMWAMGFRPGRDIAMLAFGYGPHVWLWGVHYALNLMRIPIITAGGLDSRLRARFIDQFQPTILACTPSYSLYLAGIMRRMNIDPASTSIRYLFCAGEPGFSIPATRALIESTWDAELHEFYGCTEAAPSAGGYTCGVVAGQKETQVSTHLMADTGIWETVDANTLLPTRKGHPGLSVVTNLCSEASPQFRFLVGDFTTLIWDRCECGRTHPRALGGFHGRADDMVNVRGVTLFPSSVENAVRRVPGAGEEFQIILSVENNLDVLTVQIEACPDIPPHRHSDLAQLAEAEIRSCCELRPVIEVVPHGTLPKSEFKARRLKDLRNLSG